MPRGLAPLEAVDVAAPDEDDSGRLAVRSRRRRLDPNAVGLAGGDLAVDLDQVVAEVVVDRPPMPRTRDEVVDRGRQSVDLGCRIRVAGGAREGLVATIDPAAEAQEARADGLTVREVGETAGRGTGCGHGWQSSGHVDAAQGLSSLPALRR